MLWLAAMGDNKFVGRLDRLRSFFRRKQTSGIIMFLWPTGFGVGMASYSDLIPRECFYISYALLCAATLWSIGAFLASDVLRRLREEKRPKTRMAMIIPVPLLILALGVFVIAKIAHIQRARELMRMNGVLVPANDKTTDPCPCPGAHASPSALRLCLGATIVVAESNSIVVVGHGRDRQDQIIFLGVDRLKNNTLELTSNILDDDGKVVMSINNNHFEINRNRILDSLSPPRPDKSTIIIKDSNGNKLTVGLV